MVAEVVDIIVVDLMSFTQIRFHDFKVILAEKLKQAFQRGQGPPSGHNNRRSSEVITGQNISFQ